MRIYKKNETWMKIECDRDIAYHLRDYFSFFAPGYQFTPKYKAKIWDGKIRLFNLKNWSLYVGLLKYLVDFCKSNDYTIEYLDPTLLPKVPKSTIEESVEFLQNLSFCNKHSELINPRDYQWQAIGRGIKKPRTLIISPTSSGKSLMIYGLLRWYLTQLENKILILVPTVNLVQQLYSDFQEYSSRDEWNVEDHISKIHGGKEKNSEQKVYISTWQSIYKLDREYFSQFDMIVTDEVHLATADSIRGICEKSDNATVKIGLTGTIHDTKVHQLMLEGLFGPLYTATTTKELMEKNHISKLELICIKLNYRDDERKLVKKLKYQEEIDFIINNDRRSKFISRLAQDQKGNVMVLFKRIKHGEALYQQCSVDSKKNFYYISGETHADDREEIRKHTDRKDGIALIASTGVFSTGANIPNLQSLIFAHPAKSPILNAQSLGRVLRLDGKDNRAILFDIVDDLGWKKYQNYALRHWESRLELYEREGLKYRIIEVDL